jgi:hypothetical protein
MFNKKVTCTISYLLILLVLVSCKQATSVSAEVIDEEIIGIRNPDSAQVTVAPVLQATQTPSFTSTPLFTPTVDSRIPPSEWKNWPIIPSPNNRSSEIYEKGLKLGNNPYAFSKIGDCQNVSSAFLGIFDRGGYSLLADQKEWSEAIDHFRGYFNRDGEAFGQGLNVAAALSPIHANPEKCQANESPLQCELRVVKPSLAFISFERWWPEVTPPEIYEKYLRIVLDTVIENGTVPILITKADNIEGNQIINQIIVNLAFEYDIPLYNWWKAAQALPHRGMDPVRDDGFHISEQSWYERSIFGLGTLYSIWKGVTNQ